MGDLINVLEQVFLELLSSALLVASFSAIYPLYRILLKIFRKGEEEKISYSDKLKNLTNELEKNAEKLDSTLHEFSSIVKERERKIKQLETELLKLEASEKEYKERISALENVPIAAIDHLLKQLEPSERKSARRDYLLFIAGLLLGAIVSIILSLSGIT